MQVTTLNSSQLKDILLEHLEIADKIIVDLSRISEFDSSGIQLIKSLRKSALKFNKDFVLEDISPIVQQKILVLGIKL